MKHIAIGIGAMLACAVTMAGQAIAAEALAGTKLHELAVLVGGIGEEDLPVSRWLDKE